MEEIGASFKGERLDPKACFPYCSSLYTISQSEKIRKSNTVFLQSVFYVPLLYQCLFLGNNKSLCTLYSSQVTAFLQPLFLKY